MKRGIMSQPLSDDEQALAAGYVLGDLSVDEMAHVAALLQHKPEFTQEVNALQASLQLIPHALPKVEPPPQLQASILAAHAASLAPASSPSSSTRQAFPWSRIIAGIAGLATLLLSADNFRLRRQFSLAQNPDPPESDNQRVAAILQQPTSRLVALEGEDNAAAGTLLFTPGRWQEVVVSLGDLPPLPVDQVYRMWLTLANGEVIFCGEFNTNTDGAVFIRLTPPELPPQGVKATGIFVTADATSAPLTPTGPQFMVGEL